MVRSILDIFGGLHIFTYSKKYNKIMQADEFNIEKSEYF